MMQCQHNEDGQFMDETDDTKAGPRCANEADVLVFSGPQRGVGTTLLCSKAPEHLMLLSDELTASEIPFRVFQLVDVTEAVNNEQPVRIEIERGSDPEHTLAITWSHEESQQITSHATLAN